MMDVPNTVAAPVAPRGGGPFAAAAAPAAPAAMPEVGVHAEPGAAEAAAAALQRHADGAKAELSFRVDEELGRVVVTVLDRRDGTVLRQIPSEEALRIARRLAEQDSHLVDAMA